MELKPAYGIDDLLFGMTEVDVIKILGNPDKIFEDEDEVNKDNLFYRYHSLKITLNFYKEEGKRLAYIFCSNPEIVYDGKKIIHRPIAEVKSAVFGDIKNWQIERYRDFDTYTNENVWLTFNVEYEEVTQLEIGVNYTDNDEYDWKK